jgi:hypothetical protein
MLSDFFTELLTFLALSAISTLWRASCNLTLRHFQRGHKSNIALRSRTYFGILCLTKVNLRYRSLNFFGTLLILGHAVCRVISVC